MTTKDMLKITINLVVIYVIGGLVLALVYSVASPIMFKKGEEEKQAALNTMMPEANKIEEIEKDYFLKRFENKTVETLVVIKGETQDKVEAISGATISSRAVTEDGVRNGIKMLIEKFW